MKRRTALLASAALALTLAMPAAAQQVVQPRPGEAGTWRLIGSTKAAHTIDHDSIYVRGPYDNFRAIKFKVTHAPLQLYRLVVTYGNGNPDEIEVRENIPKGGESRVIDLRGIGTRHIRRIDFWYDTKGLMNGQARVTVFGMK